VSSALALPLVIQGGMGVGVSSWPLARAVALGGQLGVVSGTALDTLFVRRLQDGDLGGHLRRALARFPHPGASAEVLARYFRRDGRPAGTPYKPLALYEQVVDRVRERVTVLANFAEVFLAKEGHDGPVGLNLLTKVQLPTLASLYGAMLAGVDYVLMGAGIPREIPGALDRLAEHRPASLKLELEGAEEPPGERVEFEPAAHRPPGAAALRRPRFLAIVASNSLAALLARRASGHVDGFVVEGPSAGGHNAPPRGEPRHNERGEPLYGARDEVDLGALAALGRPFWLAGGSGSPERLAAARAAGAAGIQVGTLFAFCRESGLLATLKRRVLAALGRGAVDVVTDPRASPTGYPFKVVQLEETLAEEPAYAARARVCDLGYLRRPYRRPDGELGYRCPAEPVERFVAKGGDGAETAGRKCLCNALLADVGHGQTRPGRGQELPLVTGGDELARLPRALVERGEFSAADVLAYLLGPAQSAAGPRLPQ
jgi:NAD(P)H-dependent flavin oxidoreductase YrpB (nitropropane dioxygenase family)